MKKYQNALNLKQTDKKATWQDLLKLTPIIYAFLVALTYLKEIVYFSLWSVQIADYLDLSEMLTSSLDDLIIFIIILLFFTVFCFPFVVYNYFKKFIKHENIKMKTINVRRKIQIVYTVCFNIVFLFILKCSDFYFEKLMLIIYVPILSVILLFIYLPVLNTKRLPINRTILLLLISLMYSTVHFAYSSAYTKRVGKVIDDYIVEIKYKDEPVKSEGDKYFIRMTKNYIFYYDSQNTIAYPIKDVGYIKSYTKSDSEIINLGFLKKMIIK